MQGLNITIQIKRKNFVAKDDVGGGVSTEVTIATGVKARISSVKPTTEMRAQGLEVDKLHNMVVHPATVDIQEGDTVIPESGPHQNDEFRVDGVQVSSVKSSSPRAHISVRLKRVERARSVF